MTVNQNQITDLAKYYEEAMRELGYDSIDSNGANQIGFHKNTITSKNGRRVDTANSFLKMAADRNNLHISINSHVTKIPVKADLPVGQNLQDHIFVPIYFFPNVSWTITEEKLNNIWNLMIYLTTGKGKYPIFSKISRFKFLFLFKFQFQFKFRAVVSGTHLILNHYFSTEDIVLKMAEKNQNGFTVLPALLRPRSTGSITLQSTDPFDPPLIDPQYFTQKEDIDIFLKGVKKTLELGHTKAFKALGINIRDTYIHFPQCKKYDAPSDGYLECYIRHYATHFNHPTSTCRMGHSNDPTAVVDQDLRVKGISNLRVVDASVMRNVVSGNTNAPTIMIAEKAADLIRVELLSQGYVCDRLTSSLRKFYGRYGELVIHYDVPLSRMVDDILS
ncbi:hypothetical protein FSP39_022571 [Pinctada imbricata]|uniref:Glucose-methanol-choline oxidoreductase C-terminal domain-containing protein n=1 Tax=Pinctada imbricata TaxID=66713 RepID=A0AA88YFL7_PINIB|nr:hypothetical protein FSP39_022571 [Pinctada imbricata]